jgi:hypothetical protein
MDNNNSGNPFGQLSLGGHCDSMTTRLSKAPITLERKPVAQDKCGEQGQRTGIMKGPDDRAP